MTTPAAQLPAAVTLAELATRRDELREQHREVQTEEKRLKALLDDNEQEIIDQLDAQGVTRSGIGPFSMSISETVVGNVEDWDSVYAFIKDNDAFYLLQRRLANAAYKELLDNGDTIEGVAPFTKRSLNFRKSSAK